MSLSCDNAWERCLSFIEKQLQPQSFITWFKPIVPHSLKDSVLTIKVPNKFFYEWIEDKYIDLLKMALSDVLGEDCKLKYLILNSEIEKPVHCSSFSKQEALVYSQYQVNYKKDINDLSFNSRYRFDNFVDGLNNKLVKSAAMAIAQNPGKTSLNPFFLYGKVGNGKTHLVQAIGNFIMDHDKTKKVTYVTSNSFVSQYISAIKSNSIYDFSNKFLQADLLVFDDIQFFSGKIKSQEIFFHIFNHFHQNNKQIIMTSDTPSNQIQGLEERLLSRFKWGFTASLSTPDMKTREQIIASKFCELGSPNIDYKIVNYIASLENVSVRELEGIINSLVINSRLLGQKIKYETVVDIVNQIVCKVEGVGLEMKKILEVVADYYSISCSSMVSKERGKSVSLARQVVMYISKYYTKNSVKTIGTYLGNRHHSTVLYSIDSIQKKIYKDNAIKKSCEEIRRKLAI